MADGWELGPSGDEELGKKKKKECDAWNLQWS